MQQWFEPTRWFDNIGFNNSEDIQKESARLYHVSLLKLATFITKSLHELPLFRRAIQIVDHAIHCVRLGFYAANRRCHHCVLLGLGIDEGELEKIINVVFSQESPSLLLLPSCDDVPAHVLQALRRKGSDVIALQQWQNQDVLIDKNHVLRSFNDICKANKMAKSSCDNLTPGQSYQFPTPVGANWEDLTFELINGETFLITGDCESGFVSEEVSFAQLGLKDKRNGKPCRRWWLLELFAQHNGKLTWCNQGMTSKLRTLKYELVKVLQARFNLYHSDPFRCMTEEGGRVTYQAKMTMRVRGK